MSPSVREFESINPMDMFLGLALALSLQVPQDPRLQDPRLQAPSSKAPVERLGPNLFRVGNIRVDTAKRELTVTGKINDVSVLEFFANSLGGMKAYESAITLDTDAINFNVALVLMGLDRRNAKGAKTHFDPDPVSGDAVSITVEWKRPDGAMERGPVEKLLADKNGADIPPGDWVYTGSSFYPDGRYAAEAEGVLIGFAHTPTSIIESVTGIGLGRYGTIVLNPKLLRLMPITLRIAALAKPEGGR